MFKRRDEVQPQLPERLRKLGPRQRQLARIILLNGGATVRDIHAQLEDAPSSVSVVRALLLRMARKGLVRARQTGHHREKEYVLAVPDETATLMAFERIAREHFQGSRGRAIAALQKLSANEDAPFDDSRREVA